MPRAPLVISHRTQAGTMPENSLVGIDAALEAGVDGIELDVRATADGVPVLLHDETLERTTGDDRALSDMTYEELRALSLQSSGESSGDPQPVPTLAQALERIAGRAIIAVEVKQLEIHDQIAAEVRRANATNWTWIWSFHPDACIACRRILPEVPASLLVAPDSLERFGFGEEPVALAVREGLAGISWNHTMVDEPTIEGARRRGLVSYCWTPNTPADIERVISAGVDGVCSDFPDRVANALAR